MCFLIITFGVINDVVDGSEACNYKQLPRYLGTSDRIFQCTICNGQLQWLKNKLPIAHHMASSRIGVKSRTSPHAFSILTRKSNDSGVCLTAILVQTATGHQPVIGTLVCRGGMTRHYCRRSSDLYHPSQTHRDHIHLKRITVHGLNFTAHMFMCEVLGRNSLSWLINDEIYCRYSSNPVNKQCISVMSNKLLKGSFELQSGHLSSFTGMLYISDEVYYHGLFNVTCKSGNVSNLMIITSVVMQTQGTTEIGKVLFCNCKNCVV